MENIKYFVKETLLFNLYIYPNIGNNTTKGWYFFMKKIIVIILIIFVLFIMFNDSNDSSELRFRVIANSDSIVDQNLKYKVVRELQKIKISKKNLDIIKKKAEYIVLSNNFNYKLDVSIKNQSFETKYYNNKIIEGGVYKTIVVTLGKGEGKNYWTILYPEYFNVSFEDINTGNVKYDIWIIKKIKEILG
jgi:stage II sporulation protein R